MRIPTFVLLAVASPAAAEVKSVTDYGFEIAGRAEVDAPPAKVYTALGRVGEWWSPAHTYSGDAKNLKLAVEPGGCFCETVPANGSRIEHGRVVYLQPDTTLRLNAALGPLQAEGASGALTFALKPVAGGRTEVTMSYVVGGYIRPGSKALAPIVDKVLSEQLSRLKAYAAR